MELNFCFVLGTTLKILSELNDRGYSFLYTLGGKCEKIQSKMSSFVWSSSFVKYTSLLLGISEIGLTISNSSLLSSVTSLFLVCGIVPSREVILLTFLNFSFKIVSKRASKFCVWLLFTDCSILDFSILNIEARLASNASDSPGNVSTCDISKSLLK